MNRISRAAGFAAAAVALAAAANISAPSEAQGTDAATIVATAPVDGTSAASIDAALDGAEARVALPEAATSDEKPGVVSRLWSTATNWIGIAKAPAANAALPTTANRSLDELVRDYAGETTDSREQDCLAKAVYFEARSEPLDGQLAVAEVVINRAGSGRYPADLCSVITQPWQFSFIRKGRFPAPDMGSDAWRKAVAVAKIAQGQLADRLPSNVLWYHADYVAPSWGKRLKRQTKIGLHIFYS
jgi:spore germination cell wall hydrolase CwlJ-like protein